MLIGIVLTFTIVVIRNAWVADDAYITFRTVDNFVNGLGLTWNACERVQAYTHPLWMLLMTAVYSFTREAFFTSIFVSTVISSLCVWILSSRLAISKTAAIGAVLVLTLSKAFIDFSTSGLENPLSHLLITLFLLVFLDPRTEAKQWKYLSVLASLIGLTRPDLLLVVAPVLAYEIWRQRSWKSVGVLVLGFSPMLVWHLFSLFYYGFMWPNTAYAKLGAGVEWTTLMMQGFHYLSVSLMIDPLTLVIPTAACVAAFVARRRPLILIALGMMIYFIYIVRVGGCFMSGRMLTVPLLLGVVILIRLSINWSQKGRWILLASILLLGLTMSRSPLYTTSTYGGEDEESKFGHGIVDERGWYFPGAGLLNASGRNMPSHRYAKLGRTQNVPLTGRTTVGYYGYFAGPDTYVIDLCGLGDALLARLPLDTSLEWRIGHNFRSIPDGYSESIVSQENLLSDLYLNAYYDHLLRIIRYPLFDSKRIQTIIDMNLGRYDYLLDQYSNHN